MINSLEFKHIYTKFIEPNFDERCRFPLADCLDILQSETGKNFNLQFGSGHCIVWADMPDGIKTITFIVVEEKMRNQGLGSYLLEDWTKNNKFPKVVVEAVGELAANFWKRNGYHEIPKLRYVRPPLKDGREPDSDAFPLVNFNISAADGIELMKNVWKYNYGFTDAQVEKNLNYMGVLE